MTQVIEGMLNGTGQKYAIIATRFNELITRKLLEGAQDTLVRHGIIAEDITLVWAPGAFEIPLVAQKLAESKKYDAVITVGAVIRGATPHFDYVSSEVSKGVAHASMATGVPIIFGVLTTDTIEQAIERAGTKAGNKGADAAMSAIEMVDLMKKLGTL